jgi:hypothetical protein
VIASRRVASIPLRAMALALIAAFWLALAAFLLFAPGTLFRNDNPRLRRYAAAGCTIFAAFALVALVAG